MLVGRGIALGRLATAGEGQQPESVTWSRRKGGGEGGPVQLTDDRQCSRKLGVQEENHGGGGDGIRLLKNWPSWQSHHPHGLPLAWVAPNPAGRLSSCCNLGPWAFPVAILRPLGQGRTRVGTTAPC